MMKTRIVDDDHELIGYYFLIANSDGGIENQGKIASRVDDYGTFMVHIFNWLDGSRSFSRIVSMDDIHKHFYLTSKELEVHSEICESKPRLTIFPW